MGQMLGCSRHFFDIHLCVSGIVCVKFVYFYIIYIIYYTLWNGIFIRRLTSLASIYMPSKAYLYTVNVCISLKQFELISFLLFLFKIHFAVALSISLWHCSFRQFCWLDCFFILFCFFFLSLLLLLFGRFCISSAFLGPVQFIQILNNVKMLYRIYWIV